jgi:hypothetical protein
MAGFHDDVPPAKFDVTAEHVMAFARRYQKTGRRRPRTAAAIGNFTILLKAADYLCGNEHIPDTKGAGRG